MHKFDHSKASSANNNPSENADQKKTSPTIPHLLACKQVKFLSSFTTYTHIQATEEENQFEEGNVGITNKDL